MGLFDRIRDFLSGGGQPRDEQPREIHRPDAGPASRQNRERSDRPLRGVDELARRLAMSRSEILTVAPVYRTFTIPKRTGGTRQIVAPVEPFKAFQRRLLRRVLGRLPVHAAATAFERGASIVDHAVRHAGKAVVVRMDIRDFFPSISDQRVIDYFRAIGWDFDAANLLTRWTTHEGSLPQGAPTSPKLANVVNYRLDTRIAAAMTSFHCPHPVTGELVTGSGLGITYSRYADDLTLSFEEDFHNWISAAISCVKRIVEDEGYRLHTKKKLRIMRRHDRQLVTGLVVNHEVNLPREVRRRLRAVSHHLSRGRPASMTAAQLAGWRALQRMITASSLPPGEGEG